MWDYASGETTAAYHPMSGSRFDGERMRRLVLLGLVTIALATTGCGTSTTSASLSSSPPPGAESPAGVPETAPPAAETPAIVGEWVGIHDCQQIVSMLTEAKLVEFLADPLEQLVPGDPTVAAADPSTACEGAVQRQHSHFFTAAGEFGSKDHNGQRVDDGTYTLEGADGIVINGQRFKYEIDGDELSLEPEPVDISACTTRECRFMATWVLMVALPGSTWKRGEIPVS
jgi:hypothetical protein